MIDISDNRDSIIVISDDDVKSDLTIVVFGGLYQRPGLPVFEFFKMLAPYEGNKVFVRDLNQCWYSKGLDKSNNLEEVLIELKAKLEAFNSKKVVFLGNSAGAYAALVFGTLLEIDHIIAFSPQTFLSKLLRLLNREKRWGENIKKLYQNNPNPNYFLDLKAFFKKHSISKQQKAEVFFALNSKMDRRHYDRIKNVPGLEFQLFDYGGHALIKEMKQNGELTKYLDTVLSNYKKTENIG